MLLLLLTSDLVTNEPKAKVTVSVTTCKNRHLKSLCIHLMEQ